MKVLFICDEKDEWSFYRNLFAGNFSKVEVAFSLNSEDALDKLNFEGPFALIIIDASLKSEGPSEIADAVIDTAGERPIVFIGEKIHITSRIRADLYEENDINEILIKPFQPEQFVETIQKGLEWVKQEEFEQSIIELDRSQVLPMRIRNFYLFDKLPYEVYLELTSTKFVKVLGKNKKYAQSDINAYAKRGIKQLYLFKNEYLKLLEEGLKKVLFILKQKNKQSPKVLMATQIKGVLIVHQYIRSVGVTKSLTELCDELIDTTRVVFRSYQKIKTLINDFPFSQYDTAEQAVFTSYLCESILCGLGWASDTSRKKLGLASLLYDSMITNEDLAKIKALDDRNLLMFTEDEQIEYKEHPRLAAEMARQFQGYSDVDFIIVQHHERPKGDGFPNRLTSNKLTAHSCAFILATAFSTRLALLPGEQGNYLKVFREIKTLYNVGNFKEPLDALQRSMF